MGLPTTMTTTQTLRVACMAADILIIIIIMITLQSLGEASIVGIIMAIVMTTTQSMAFKECRALSQSLVVIIIIVIMGTSTMGTGGLLLLEI